MTDGHYQLGKWYIYESQSGAEVVFFYGVNMVLVMSIEYFTGYLNIGFFLRAYLNLVCLFNETFCCCKLKKNQKSRDGSPL